MKSTRTTDEIIEYYDSLKEDAVDDKDFKKMQKLEAFVIHHFILTALLEGFPEERDMGEIGICKFCGEVAVSGDCECGGYNKAIQACRSHIERVLKGEKE